MKIGTTCLLGEICQLFFLERNLIFFLRLKNWCWWFYNHKERHFFWEKNFVTKIPDFTESKNCSERELASGWIWKWSASFLTNELHMQDWHDFLTVCTVRLSIASIFVVCLARVCRKARIGRNDALAFLMDLFKTWLLNYCQPKFLSLLVLPICI